MRIALIPVKELARAKARLAPALDERARRELSLALFADVLDATLACPQLDGVAVTTSDSDVLTHAREAGAIALAEPSGPSGGGSGPALNAALTAASLALRARGATRLLIVAADLPTATPDDLTLAVEADADVVVVPSTDGGTNALALAPDAISLQFGPNSARRHLDAATAAGLRALRLDLPSLALDIDTPDDLARLGARIERGAGARTRALWPALSGSLPQGQHS